LRYTVQVEADGYLSSLNSSMVDVNRLVVTFDGLLRRTSFAKRMKGLLATLEKHYGSPVDTEFTAEIVDPNSAHPDVRITLLQCRPQSHLRDAHEVELQPSLIWRMLFSPPGGWSHAERFRASVGCCSFLRKATLP